MAVTARKFVSNSSNSFLVLGCSSADLIFGETSFLVPLIGDNVGFLFQQSLVPRFLDVGKTSRIFRFFVLSNGEASRNQTTTSTGPRLKPLNGGQGSKKNFSQGGPRADRYKWSEITLINSQEYMANWN